MPKAIDITGEKYGMLTAISYIGRKRLASGSSRVWLFACECGGQIECSIAYVRHGGRKHCGCLAKKMNQSHSWRGGKRLKDGYVMVYCPEHYRSGTNGYVREHIKVMSEYLGRDIEKHESVHHKNGDRADNRIENLELWRTNQPAGQRVVDLLQRANEILEKYKDMEYLLRLQK